LKKGSKVVVIEDHISTGVSAVGNAQTIRELGGKVIYCIATTTFETPLSKKNLKENKIKLLYLTTGKIILDQAFKNKKLTLEEKKKVDSWFDDPPAWYQKYY
jgi:orotate phosphoribosyltransferase